MLYAFLAAFFAAMLLVFFQTLDLYQPRWQNANGLIGTNPGEDLIRLSSDTFPIQSCTVHTDNWAEQRITRAVHSSVIWLKLELECLRVSNAIDWTFADVRRGDDTSFCFHLVINSNVWLPFFYNLIGNSGLGFRPMPTGANVESTLIHFKHGTAGNWQHWTSELEKFLHRKPFKTIN